jgi:hypothetical protein
MRLDRPCENRVSSGLDILAVEVTKHNPDFHSLIDRFEMCKTTPQVTTPCVTFTFRVFLETYAPHVSVPTDHTFATITFFDIQHKSPSVALSPVLSGLGSFTG